MKLGLQFSAVSEVLQTYSGLNDARIQPRDLRELLSKFVYNESRRCFLYILSFSSSGSTIDVVCTRATGAHGDYDAATLFIPSGAKIEGGKLSTIVGDLKEELILSPQRRIDPSKASYARYFEEEHSDDEFPVLPEPKSEETAFIVFGYGASHPSLVRLLINLYRPAYSHFRNIVLLDNIENIAPSSGRGGLENAGHGFDSMRRDSEYVTDLSNSPLPVPNVLYRVEVAGGVQPSGLLVDNVLVQKLPIFVGPKFSLGFHHEHYLFTPQIIQIPPDGVVRLRDINWDMKLHRSDFIVTDTDLNPVDLANVYVNGRFLSNQIIIPLSEAATAEVAVEARAYHSFRSRMDLTAASVYNITLSGSRLARKYVVDGTPVSFLLEQKDTEVSNKKPLKGYSFVNAGRDGEYHLAYDKFAFFRNPLFISSGALILLLGFIIGFLLGKIGQERQVAMQKTDSRPGVELFASNNEAQADNPVSKNAADVVEYIFSEPEDTVVTPEDTVSEENALTEDARDVPESLENIETAPSPVDPSAAAALEYLKANNVWNRDSLESFEASRGLWDAVNHYNVAKIMAINENIKCDLLDEIADMLRKKGKTGSYVLDPDPSDKNADKNITVSVYINKIK